MEPPTKTAVVTSFTEPLEIQDAKWPMTEVVDAWQQVVGGREAPRTGVDEPSHIVSSGWPQRTLSAAIPDAYAAPSRKPCIRSCAPPVQRCAECQLRLSQDTWL